MVEVLVASAFVAGGVIAASRLGHSVETHQINGTHANGVWLGDDLPCPWCGAATTESDARCPNCHQRFG